MVNHEQKSWADFGVVLQITQNLKNSEIQICGEAPKVLLKFQF